MRWIALLLIFTGCASTRVSLTRHRGEPVISIEFRNEVTADPTGSKFPKPFIGEN